MTTKKKTQEDLLIYKGHPFMRNGNIIYYGSMSDKYIIMLQILETKEIQDLNVSAKVSVELQQTSVNVKAKDRIVKRAEKAGLYTAMDVAVVWLDRALNS